MMLGIGKFSLSVFTDEKPRRRCNFAGALFFRGLAPDPEFQDGHKQRCRRDGDHPLAESFFTQAYSPPFTATDRDEGKVRPSSEEMLKTLLNLPPSH